MANKNCSEIEIKIRQYIKTWEGRGYNNGIPDEAPHELESIGRVPSYKRICRAILINDLTLSTLGFSKPNSEWYGILKRIELGINNPIDNQINFEGEL